MGFSPSWMHRPAVRQGCWVGFFMGDMCWVRLCDGLNCCAIGHISRRFAAEEAIVGPAPDDGFGRRSPATNRFHGESAPRSRLVDAKVAIGHPDADGLAWGLSMGRLYASFEDFGIAHSARIRRTTVRANGGVHPGGLPRLRFQNSNSARRATPLCPRGGFGADEGIRIEYWV